VKPTSSFDCSGDRSLPGTETILKPTIINSTQSSDRAIDSKHCDPWHVFESALYCSLCNSRLTAPKPDRSWGGWGDEEIWTRRADLSQYQCTSCHYHYFTAGYNISEKKVWPGQQWERSVPHPSGVSTLSLVWWDTGKAGWWDWMREGWRDSEIAAY